MTMQLKWMGSLLFAGLVASCASKTSNERGKVDQYPNVIVIYTDDLGYGDISAYGGMVPTPNVDFLAAEGLKFTNAYATSATCTPSRFSLLTGEYAWRTPGTGVVDGDATALIKPGRETWPKVMQRAGYRTSVIGKWHLGLGDGEGPDWNGKISPGPLEIGFDYSFLVPATNDRVPTVFVENHHVVDLDPEDPIKISFSERLDERPTGKDNPELLKMMWSHGHNHTITNGISRIGYMAGGESALWRDEDIADVMMGKAVEFIDSSGDQPFFIYFSTVDIHVPRIVHERFQGSTAFGPRGDMIAQLDWSVGMLMEVLEKRGLQNNTMIIFTSDNGPVLDDGYVDHAEEKLGEHKPSGLFRGGKYSAFEAGTRVPMIVRWPGHVPSGEVSDALFSQVDMLASFAAFAAQEFDERDASDSQNHWQVLIGQQHAGRAGIVQEAIQKALSYVTADGYKYIPSHKGSVLVPWGTGIETGFSDEEQLFHLGNDPAEQVNLAKQPEFQPVKDSLKIILQNIRSQQ